MSSHKNKCTQDIRNLHSLVGSKILQTAFADLSRDLNLNMYVIVVHLSSTAFASSLFDHLHWPKVSRERLCKN